MSSVFLDGVCRVWPHDPEPPLDHAGSLLVATASTPHLDEIASSAAMVIVEPTVGPPSDACVVAAITAFFAADGDAIAAPPACSRPPEIRDPDAAVVMIPGRYVYDEDLTVNLLVPEGWSDSGFGTWYREDSPLDETNLDVYIWLADGVEEARREFVAEWEMSDPSYREQTLGGHRWLLAEGGVEWDSTDRIHQVIAVGEVDGSIVGVVMQTDATEAAEIVDAVLVPSLESVTVDS